MIRPVEALLSVLRDSTETANEKADAETFHFGKNSVGTGKRLDHYATPKERDHRDGEEERSYSAEKRSNDQPWGRARLTAPLRGRLFSRLVYCPSPPKQIPNEKVYAGDQRALSD